MANNLYTTKTAALKATKADINKLDAKKLKVNGKDVATSVKHPDDTREVITLNDLWGSWAEIKDGEIIFHDDEVTNPNKSNYSAWNTSITKVEYNKGYIGDSFYANIQTENIKVGSYMFYKCSNLTSFNGDLSSLTNGRYMFYYCTKLTTFNYDLSSLTNGGSMFINCYNLTTFTGDLSSLKDGNQMFNGCTRLTKFTSDLSSLTNGSSMFSGCILDTDSLIHIAETINTVTDSPSISIGIGNTAPTEEETELLTEIHNKGWAVYVKVNGGSSSQWTPTALTPINGEEVTTPIPYWAKPQETDEEHAEYVGEDGKYYIILGGNYIFVDDPESYGLFTSLEDAAANMRLTKIEKTTNQN